MRVWRSDAGAVTAEFAILVPAVIALTIFLFAVVSYPLKITEMSAISHSFARQLASGFSQAETQRLFEATFPSYRFDVEINQSLLCTLVSEKLEQRSLVSLFSNNFKPAQTCTFIYGY